MVCRPVVRHFTSVYTLIKETGALAPDELLCTGLEPRPHSPGVGSHIAAINISNMSTDRGSATRVDLHALESSLVSSFMPSMQMIPGLSWVQSSL